MNTTINSPNTMIINDFPFPIHTGAVKPNWIETAKIKGFDIAARVVDRLHLALRCHQCGSLNKVRIFTLMFSQPQCAACTEEVWKAEASIAGLEFLHRDPTDRHYGVYRASCGHEVRRQFGLIKQVVAKETGLRCETCHSESEAAAARSQGWDLIGPDCDDDPNYRMYLHLECGHKQRVARVNMQTGRFSCAGCGVEWPAAPSFIYAMGFTTESGRELVKAGFSRNPDSRLHHQLKRDPKMPGEILAKVAIPTGQQALRLEKRLHACLQRSYPEHVVDPSVYRGQIRVASEIYDAELTQTILAQLAEIAAEIVQERADGA